MNRKRFLSSASAALIVFNGLADISLNPANNATKRYERYKFTIISHNSPLLQFNLFNAKCQAFNTFLGASNG